MAAVGVLLTRHWLPLGPQAGLARNLAFVTLLVGGLLAVYACWCSCIPACFTPFWLTSSPS